MGTPGQPPSNITLGPPQVDAPVVQDANYEFDQFDRAYIDSQVRGLESLVTTLVTGGMGATIIKLASSSAAAPVGAVVCSVGIAPPQVTLALTAALATASPLGIVISSAAPGGFLGVATSGIVPASITGLPTGTAGFAVINGATGMLAFSSLASGAVGTVDVAGNLTIVQSIGSAASIGPGPLNAISVPATLAYTVSGAMGVNPTGNGPIFAAKPAASNAEIDTALIAATLPQSTPWWVDFACNDRPYDISAAYPVIGPVVASGTTNADSAYSISRYWNAAAPSIQIAHFHPGSTRTAFANAGADAAMDAGFFRARILNDGTTLHYQVSWDGFFWVDWYSEATPSGLAYYGFCIGNGASTGSTGQLAASIYRNVFSPTLNVPQSAVNAASNVSPIVMGTVAPHGLLTGDLVAIHGVGGNTNANTGTGNENAGNVPVVVLSPTTFQAIGTGGNGSYTSGGTVTCVSR